MKSDALDLLVCQRSKFLSLALLVLAKVGLGTGLLGAPVEVSFVGPDRAHVKYDIVSTIPNTQRTELIWQNQDLQLQTLAQGGASLSGIRGVTGMARGTHQFLVKITYLDTQGKEQFSTSTGAMVVIDPAKAYGRLLLNESISGAGSKLECTAIVSEGLQLELANLATGSRLGITGEGGKVVCRNSRLDVIALEGRGTFEGQDLRIREAMSIPRDMQATFRRCKFLQRYSTVDLVGGAGASPGALVVIEDCELYGAVSLAGPRPATFTRDVLLGPISLQGQGWDANGAENLAILDNSFLGREALTYSGATLAKRIAIGTNYYGDLRGPNTWAFAGGRGASVNTNAFDLGQPPRLADAAARRFPTDTSRFPDVQAIDCRIGQNTLVAASSYVLRRDRESLVSVDVVSSWQRLTGVRVYAELDGTRLESQNTPPVLRDWYDFAGSKKDSARAVETGQTTFNVILPPQTKTSANLKLYLDTTGVSGFDEEGKLQMLLESTLQFQAPPQRTFNVGVVPVQVQVRGYPNTVPNARLTAEVLRSFLPAMLTLKAKDVQVSLDPLVVYDSDSAGWFDSWTTYSLYYTVSSFLEAYLEEYNALAAPEARYDRLIGVVASGALGVDGVNVVTARSVSLVEEDKPLASLHELGHSFGLYTSTEQYDLEGYPNGYPVLGVTGFIPETGLTVSAFNGYRSVGRIHHYAELTGEEFFDVMGSVEPVWMVWSTFRQWQDSLANLLSQPRTLHSLAQTAALPASAPAGTRRILVRGAYARSGDPWPFDKTIPMYALIPGTLTAEDVTSLAREPVVSYNSGKAMSYQFQPLDTNGAPIWASVAYINIDDISPIESPIGFWSQSFDIPQASAGFQVVSTDIYGPPLIYVDLRQKPVVELLRPTAGQVLATTMPLELSITGSASPSAFTHRLYFSTDGGATWKAWGSSLHGDRHELATSGLPSATPFALKIVSSDGLRNLENRVDGLSVLPVPPQVQITSPRPAERGGTATRWSLRALVVSGSDPITSAQWTSSRDGVLGSGQELDQVQLSPGQHVLTFVVGDAGGRESSASVSVEVLGSAGAVGAGNIPEDALQVTPAGAPAPAWRLVPSATNLLRVRLVNEGPVRSQRLCLWVQPPGGGETMLREQFFAVDSFEAFSLKADYVPDVAGMYAVRVMLETLNTDGSVSEPTERRWQIPASRPSIRVQLEPAEAVAAGAQWRIDGGPWLTPETEVIGSSLEWGIGEHLITFKPLGGWHTPPAYKIRHRPLEAVFLRGAYRVDVGTMPWFDLHPASATVVAGTNLTLRANAVGTPRPTYQWLKDGQEIAGATNRTLALKNIQAADAGTYVVVAKNTAGTVASEPAILIVVGGNTGSSFPEWVLAQDLPSDARGPEDDPDQDGLPNIVEFALALNPTQPDRETGVPRASLSGQGPERYLTFRYRRPKSPPVDLAYEVTSSRQLSPWDGTEVVAVGEPVDRDGYVEVMVRSAVPVSDSQCQFIQLRLIRK